jgi:hypothetical protein
VHERVCVRALESGRRLRFENNDPAMVRELAMDAGLAGRAGYQLDWSGTWKLETAMPAGELERAGHGLLRAHPAAHGYRREGTRRLHRLRVHHPAAGTRPGWPRAPGGTPDS